MLFIDGPSEHGRSCACDENCQPSRSTRLDEDANRSEVRPSGREGATGSGARGVAGGGFAHLLNDTIQAIIPAIYPLLKESFQLTFAQVGLITLTFQLTASILQPIVGLYADHRPVPFSLAAGMGVTLLGLILLSVAGSYALLLIAAALVGMGSSIFHPEASRVARLASGGKHGLA